MSNIKELARNASSLMGSAAVSQIVSLATLPLIAILYKPADLGIAQTFASILGMLGMICCGKLDQGILVVPEDQIPRMLSAASVFICVIGIITSLVVAAFVVREGEVAQVYFILVPAVVAGGLAQLVNAMALRRRAFRDIARTKIEQSALGFLGTVGMGLAGLGAIGLIFSQILQQTGGMLRLRRRTATEFTASSVWGHKREARAVFAENQHLVWGASAAGLVNNMAWAVPVLAIAYFYGAVEAGLFALAMKCLSPVQSFLIMTINQISMGEGASLIHGEDHKGLRRQMNSMFRISAGFGILVAAGGYAIASYGPRLFDLGKWSGAFPYVAPLVLVVAMQLAISPLTSIPILYKKQSTQFIYDVTRGAVVIGLFVVSGMLKFDIIDLLWVYAGVMAIAYCLYYVFFISLLKK